MPLVVLPETTRKRSAIELSECADRERRPGALAFVHWAWASRLMLASWIRLAGMAALSASEQETLLRLLRRICAAF